MNDDEPRTYSEYWIVLSWLEDRQGIRFEAGDVNPIIALARSPEDFPRHAFNVCGEDPGTPIVKWLVSQGCGVQKANDMVAWIGKQLYGPECDW